MRGILLGAILCFAHALLWVGARLSPMLDDFGRLNWPVRLLLDLDRPGSLLAELILPAEWLHQTDFLSRQLSGGSFQ